MMGFLFSIRNKIHIDLKRAFSTHGRRGISELPIICIMLNRIGLIADLTFCLKCVTKQILSKKTIND